MPVAITFRSSLTRDLNASEIDANFAALKTAVEDLQASAPLADKIVSVTQVGAEITFNSLLGAAFGPITLPTPLPKWRGEFAAPGTQYNPLDEFTVTGKGVYFVNTGFISVSPFDEATLIGGTTPTLTKLFGADVGATTQANQIYDIGTCYQAKLSDSTETLLFELPILRALTFPIDVSKHEAYLHEPASTVNQICPIFHNDAQIGTITFSVGVNLGVIALTPTEDIALAIGDRIGIGTPPGIDATAATLSVAFACLRVLA